MRDIHESFREAGLLHGHYCPGLAGGVRAGLLAEELLGVDCKTHKDLFCIYEKPACFIDGIQWTFGTTVGKGNLIYHPSGKAVFSFYDALSGKSVRLSMKRSGKELPREELIEYILTAPAGEIFDIGPVRLPCPQRKKGSGRAVCQCCGEEAEADKLVQKDGRLLCIDCAAL